ncbi:Ig-like domain-containing protein [Enterobacteriaceae bacterium LUAb1]
MADNEYTLSWVHPVTQTATDLTLSETLKLTDNNSNELTESIKITCTITDNPNVIFTASQSQTLSGETNIMGRLPFSVQCLGEDPQRFTLNAYLTDDPSVSALPLPANFWVASIALQPKSAQVLVNDSVTLTATVAGLTSTGLTARPNVPVTFSSDDDITLEPTTATTNEQGHATTKVTGKNPAKVTVKASVGKTSDTAQLDIEYPVKSVTLDPSDIQNNAKAPLDITATVTWPDNIIRPGVPVMFSATNGATVSPSSVNTDKNGVAVTTVYNDNVGIVTVTALAADQSGTAQITYIPAQDYYLTITPDSPTSLVSDMGHGTTRNTVTATLLDTYKKPVAKHTVSFSGDPGMVFRDTSVVTDANGQAQTVVASSRGGKQAINAQAEGETATTYITYRILH